VIENCEVVGSREYEDYDSYGIYYEYDSNFSEVENCEIENCDYGIYYEYDSNFNEVENCEIKNCDHGIYISGVSGTTILANRIENNGDGIYIEGEGSSSPY
jgi:parallel beta-helix repeat protein